MKKNLYIKQLFHIPTPTILQLDGEGVQRNHHMKEPWVTGQGVRYNILLKVKEYMLAKGYEDILEQYHFHYKQEDAKHVFKQSVAYREPDPSYLWNFVGGWMQARSEGGTLKHQSFLSVGTFGVLSKGSAEIVFSDIETINYRDDSHVSAVKYKDSVVEEYENFVKKNPELAEYLDKYHFGQSHTIGGKKLYTKGIFQNNAEIDLERFMRVNKKSCDEDAYKKCVDNGWTEHTSNKIKGDPFIVPPEEIADILIEAIAYGILSWEFTSNQTRTATELNRLGVALSYCAGSIRNFCGGFDTEEQKFIIDDGKFGEIEEPTDGTLYPYSNVEFYVNSGVGMNFFDEKIKNMAAIDAIDRAFLKIKKALKDSVSDLYWATPINTP